MTNLGGQNEWRRMEDTTESLQKNHTVGDFSLQNHVSSALAVARILPLNLHALYRKNVSEHRKEPTRQNQRKTTCLSNLKMNGIGRWIQKVIKNLSQWQNRKNGIIEFYICQVVTGQPNMGKLTPQCAIIVVMNDTTYNTHSLNVTQGWQRYSDWMS